jgi:hypothetical protein
VVLPGGEDVEHTILGRRNASTYFAYFLSAEGATSFPQDGHRQLCCFGYVSVFMTLVFLQVRHAETKVGIADRLAIAA